MSLISKLAWIFFSCILFVSLSGCGGRHAPSQVNIGSGRASCIIDWPRDTRLIPNACYSITIEIKKGSTVLATGLSDRPPEGGQALVSFADLPAEQLTAVATAYPEWYGTGTPQAQASIPITIKDGEDTQFHLTMVSTIDRIEVTTISPAMWVSGSIDLIATAKDSAGSVVLITPEKLDWASSDPAAATVDSAGKVTGVALGTAQITVTDTESGKSGSLEVQVVQSPGVLLTLGQAVADQTLSGAGDKRYYRVTLTDANPLVVLLRGSEDGFSWVCGLKVYQWSPAGPEVGTALNYGTDMSFEVAIPSPGDYCIAVENFASGSRSFTILADQRPPETLALEQQVTAQPLWGAGDVRYYKVSLVSGGSLVVLLHGSEDGFSWVCSLKVHRGSVDGEEVGTAINSGYDMSVEVLSPSSGDFYVEVRNAVSGSRSFDLQAVLR